MSFTYSFRLWLIENCHSVVGDLPVKSTIAKEILAVSSEHERSRGYRLTAYKKIEMEKSTFVGDEMKIRSLCMSLLQAALENVFEPLKRCDRISIQMNIGDRSELCFLPVIVSYFCDIPEGKYVPSINHGLLIQKLCTHCLTLLNYVERLRMEMCRRVQDNSSP